MTTDKKTNGRAGTEAASDARHVCVAERESDINQRQGARTKLAIGYAHKKRPVVTAADPAQAEILRHLRLDRRQIEDLMPNRLVGLDEHFTSAL